MMKMPLTAVAGLFAVLAPAAVQAGPKPLAPPTRILVTLQVMEVASRVPHGVPPTPYPTSGIYDALLKEGSEATEVSVQTPNDFPGVARYSRVFAFTTQDNGKPGRGFLTAPTSLEATPHINADGTITVSLKVEMTRVVTGAADAAPMTTSQSMTTRRTFRSGQTLLLGETALIGQASKPGATPEAKDLLQFVTVTVLPDITTARR